MSLAQDPSKARPDPNAWLADDGTWTQAASMAGAGANARPTDRTGTDGSHAVDFEPDRGSEPLQVTFLGRSTALLVLDGTRLLTDPSLPGRRRLPWGARVAPAAPPEVDAVLVSHGHSRHMDPATLRRLPGRPRIFVPAGDAATLRRHGLERVEEVRTGDVVRVGRIAIQVVGAEHGSLHGAFGPRHESLGYLVDGSSRVYFAGDSQPFPDMERLDGVDLALLPVAPVLRYVGQLSPDAAAETAAIVRPRVVVPIHWGAAEVVDEPAPPWVPSRELFTPERLESALARAFATHGADAEIRIVEPGYATVISPRPLATPRTAPGGAPIAPASRGLGLPQPGGGTSPEAAARS